MSHLLPSCQLLFLLWVWPAPGQSSLLFPVLASTFLMAAHPGDPPLTLEDAEVVNPLCGLKNWKHLEHEEPCPKSLLPQHPAPRL